MDTFSPVRPKVRVATVLVIKVDMYANRPASHMPLLVRNQSHCGSRVCPKRWRRRTPEAKRIPLPPGRRECRAVSLDADQDSDPDTRRGKPRGIAQSPLANSGKRMP